MAVDRQLPASPAAWPPIRRSTGELGRLTGGGISGNERLTAVTGAVLLVLLAVIGVTIVALRPLLSVHLFVGMLLIGPVALKLCTTGYRFVRYYTANPSYRSKGPPAMLLRVIAPVLVVSTVVVLASGVALLFAGPSSRGTLLPIHKVSFFIWIGFAALHILPHLPATGRALGVHSARSAGPSQEEAGRTGRALSLAGALTAGVVLAILVIPQFGAWLNAPHLHHH
jgi:hypothetical protein